MSRSSGEAGFTLIELLVALTLLGLVSVLLFGGLRFGVSPDGRRYMSFGLPGTGLYWITYFRRVTPGAQPGPSPTLPSPNSRNASRPLPSTSQPSPPAAPHASPTSSRSQETAPWWKQSDL